MHSNAIHQLAVKRHKAGSPQYLCAYKKACRQIERKLSKNQRQKYQVMAKEWSEKKPPPKIQRRYVHRNGSRNPTWLISFTSMMRKHGAKAVREFASASFKQFGMRVVVLAAYMDAEEDAEVAV